MFNPNTFRAPIVTVYKQLHNEAGFSIDASRIDVFGIKDTTVKTFPGSNGRVVGIKMPNGILVLSESHDMDEIGFAPFVGKSFKEVKDLIDANGVGEYVEVTSRYQDTSPDTWRSLSKEIASQLK